MHFLTEEDIRSRCPEAGGTLCLGPEERLTPSASEFANQMRLTISRDGSCAPAPATCAGPACAGTAPAPGMTCLDASTSVPKSHPRIVMRGKLDTLLAQVVLTQTQFDPKDRISPFLKDCLGDLKDWVFAILASEVSGSPLTVNGMGGMDLDTLHTVSRDPAMLGLDHVMPDASMGGNVALLNWLRALVRETEVAAVTCSAREDICASLNRLSSAVYVLMLLTLAAQCGKDVARLGR